MPEPTTEELGNDGWAEAEDQRARADRAEAEVERLRAAAPASEDDEPATGSFVPVLPGYYEEVARRLAAAGSPPPIPAPEQETTDGR